MEEPCGCIYVDDYDCCSELCSEKIVTARKEHKCCECNKVIQKGERYQYAKGRWEGEFGAFKTCLDCLSIREVFFCDGFLYGGMFEYLGEHLSDMDGQISSECLVKLTPGARADVCDRIETYWERYYDDDE